MAHFAVDMFADNFVEHVHGRENLDTQEVRRERNAALGEGIAVHLFFSFWGFDMITKSRMNDLQFSPVGNTAMHLPEGDAHIL